jgi:hypothetical protein
MSKMILWRQKKTELRGLIRFPIAIQIVLDASEVSNPLWLTVAEAGIRPALCSETWLFLGYDVADQGRISALSDCSYQNDEVVQARLRWSSSVNDWGLLNDFSSAIAFQGFSNGRVAEHAPFCIYKVFRIPEELAVDSLSDPR